MGEALFLMKPGQLILHNLLLVRKRKMRAGAGRRAGRVVGSSGGVVVIGEAKGQRRHVIIAPPFFQHFLKQSANAQQADGIAAFHIRAHSLTGNRETGETGKPRHSREETGNREKPETGKPGNRETGTFSRETGRETGTGKPGHSGFYAASERGSVFLLLIGSQISLPPSSFPVSFLAADPAPGSRYNEQGDFLMTPIVLTSKVGPDGVLHLALPLAAADLEVRVTVEPVVPKKEMTPEEWRAFILSTAGSIAYPTFARPPQGALQEREPLS